MKNRLIAAALLGLSMDAYATVTKEAPYALHVTLNAPQSPLEENRWNRVYSPFNGVNSCIDFAKVQWQGYYEFYPKDVGEFGTLCLASAHGKHWFTKVTCSRSGLCETQSGER